MAVLPLYFQRHYGERILSANIGTVQVALSCMGGLPGIRLANRFGERPVQLIAGALTVGGLISTAFTKEAWQGVLSSGVLVGAGAALNHVVCYSMSNTYFPSHQLPMSVAMMVSFNAAEIAWPVIMEYLVTSFGFKKAFITLGALNTINLVAGAIFTPKYATDIEAKSVDEKETPKKELSITVTGKKSGIYHLPEVVSTEEKCEENISEVFPEVEEIKKSKIKTDHIDLREVMRTVQQNSRISQVLLVAKSTDETGGERTNEKFNELSTSDDGESTKSSEEEDNSILAILRTKGVLNYLLVTLLTGGGIACFFVVLGDYAYHTLGYTLNQFSNGIIFKGVAQLIVTVGLTLITKYFLVSSPVIYLVGIMGMLFTAGLMLSRPSSKAFLAVMTLWGIFKGLHLSSFFGVCLELTTPAQSISTYTLEVFLGGLGALTLPYLAIEAQVKWSTNAGLYVSMTFLTLSVIAMLRLVCSRLISAKVCKPEAAVGNVVTPTSFDWLKN
ncbi:uncharacterized protein [Watersipora subatra]|uniref:uncharacterized protein n=1 Tax=Watersipora subatra TaxID=2589382 RepID=UPI00355C6D68